MPIGGYFSNELDVHRLSSGIYFIKLAFGNSRSITLGKNSIRTVVQKNLVMRLSLMRNLNFGKLEKDFIALQQNLTGT